MDNGVAGSVGGIGDRKFEAAAETGKAAVEVLAGDGGEAADLIEAGVVVGVGFQGFVELGEGFGVFFSPTYSVAKAKRPRWASIFVMASA